MDRRTFLKALGFLPLALGGKISTQEGIHPAMHWISLDNNRVQCRNCPNRCMLKPGETGICRARKNIDGKLYTLVYGNPCAVHLDPIEKKPLFHFMPGTYAFSIATAGCNFYCLYCQNYQISQVGPGKTTNYNLPPEGVIQNVFAYRNSYDISSIAYTYTEPTIFFEYMYDTAKIAKKSGIKNVYHSNGYIEKEPLIQLIDFLDGANIDLKFFDDQMYKKISGGFLEPVLETLKTLKKRDVHLEVTNLIIPTINDNMDEIKKMVIWIKGNIGKETPLHFSRFFPMYKLRNLPPTPIETVEKARSLALDLGMEYAYVGNVPYGHPGENTYCPHCHKLLIKRYGFSIIENHLKNGKCPYCGTRIAGVWE